jgi:hypothetical protein
MQGWSGQLAGHDPTVSQSMNHGGCSRSLSHSLPDGSTEHIMFAYLLRSLATLFERAEYSRRDAYLASSVDLFELERRMRAVECDR